MLLDVYGRFRLKVELENNSWNAYILGDEGKMRKAENIYIPNGILETEVVGYLEDLLHEWASIENNRIVTIEVADKC